MMKMSIQMFAEQAIKQRKEKMAAKKKAKEDLLKMPVYQPSIPEPRIRLTSPPNESKRDKKPFAEIIKQQESKKLERDEKYKKFSLDLGIEAILDEKFI